MLPCPLYCWSGFAPPMPCRWCMRPRRLPLFFGGETAWKPVYLQLEGCDVKWNPAAKESDDEWVIGYFEGAFEI